MAFHRLYYQKIAEVLGSVLNCNTDFRKLRMYTCARLTIFNGRRGGEVSRLAVSEAIKGLEDAWYRGREMRILRGR